MNITSLIGNATKDAYFKAGETNVARFTLAVNGYKDRTDFIPCVAFGKTAEFCRDYVKKGVKFGVTGHLTSGSYEKDGQTIYTLDVSVDNIDFCEKKKQAGTWEEPADAEELPFN